MARQLILMDLVLSVILF